MNYQDVAEILTLAGIKRELVEKATKISEKHGVRTPEEQQVLDELKYEILARLNTRKH